ncbi:hypothetical protein H6P81_002743 [Aristolochia fimbriata]|uniref:Dynamin-related protein 4C-like n=1 Tax=Aristolochia fimbriata TaxID=158543 RepID=A0AAV7FAL3_ARIFI|nr:hypothetical protein H6P81_002743 [Aristolochia fimbriata]
MGAKSPKMKSAYRMEKTVAVKKAEEVPPTEAPLLLSYNDRIRPLLDAVDRLRHLQVTKEGIPLPTIVVVGDQSSGKSSVLESLAGISLPRGQGICTRVPLIMRLQNHSCPTPELYLEYNGNVEKTSETKITDDITAATDVIAGNGKGISHTPLTLVVKKRGVPDLTMVDLPGITRVPVHGQPEDIYEQVSNIIMDFIKPEESIILNVLSATVDFPTCESIRMSQRVDRTGERTLAVVTKADKAPEGLLEKVTADDVNIGLGYVCVRNRVGDETYEEARTEEATLFRSHPLLSKIDKSIVGVPVLAQKLVQIQATSIARCLPDIVKQINLKLTQNLEALNGMPRTPETMAEAMTVFMQILGNAKESLRKILVRGEYDEFPDDMKMHCRARLAEMLDDYAKQLAKSVDKERSTQDFLMDEIEVLMEAKGIGLPNFVPRSAFLTILQRKVDSVAHTPVDFVERIWTYIEEVIVRVLDKHSDAYPQLLSSTRRVAQSLIVKLRLRSCERVTEIVEMEKLADYTSNKEYMETWTNLMEEQDRVMEAITDSSKPTLIHIKSFGGVEIGHLRQGQYSAMIPQAFDMKIRITAYWKVVILRLVDTLALHLLFSVKKLVKEEIEREIVEELMKPHMGGIQRLLEEAPSSSGKRHRLKKSISLLKESKDVVGSIMDRISQEEL